MRTVTSELLQIPGIGPAKRRDLLRAFGSVQGIREASVDDIAKIRGFNPARAARLLEALAASSPTAPSRVSA
jgi:excinuclease ABC subunit C